MEEPDQQDQVADELIAELIGNGFFDLHVSESGDVLYRLSENAEQINPEVFKVMMGAMREELIEYIGLGYVEYRLNDDLEMEYRFTPEGIAFMESQGYTFDDD